MQLFREILRIDLDTLRYLNTLTVKDRGYIEGLISKWNDEIEAQLNLAHFWSQDEQFQLSVNYKDGIVYFEIRDKTDSVYTFSERSSGLKYFLSYYVQAKAMEMSSRNRNAIVIMDEPDSALSIVGQRNLLAVFESLVSPEASGQTCQLIYTTHSPYLINRNFPRRLRVVRKEDAEQGTQYIEQARARRYEPVRSALGIDNAPSLFLGADNILMEGSTDQYLVAELIRLFATPANVGEFVDLNTAEIVSADGCGNIANVLEQSRWADEPIPPTVVIVDGDKQGLDVVADIVERRKLVQSEFVATITQLVQPFGTNSKILTIEDIVPTAIYTLALKRYLTRWLPTSLEQNRAFVETALADSTFGSNGLADSARKFFLKIQPEFEGDFDKMGVLREVLLLVSSSAAERPADADLADLKRNLVAICDYARSGLTRSRAVVAKTSAAQAIKRIVSDFRRLNKSNVAVTALQRLVLRLEREVSPIGNDGAHILKVLNGYASELSTLRASGQERVDGPQWEEWLLRIERLKNNPLSVSS